MKPGYVPVIEHFARLRSCYMYTLKRRRWLWHAKLMLWLCLKLAESDCNYWIMSPEQAAEHCARYRNWLDINRLGP